MFREFGRRGPEGVELAKRTGLAKQIEEPESTTNGPEVGPETTPPAVFNPSDEEIEKWGDEIPENIKLL